SVRYRSRIAWILLRSGSLIGVTYRPAAGNVRSAEASPRQPWRRRSTRTTTSSCKLSPDYYTLLTVTLHPDDFDPVNYVRGSCHRLAAAFGESLGFPILLARGAKPGLTLVVTANVHGDEYEGVRAILETFEELDPGSMSGDLIAVPVAN